MRPWNCLIGCWVLSAGAGTLAASPLGTGFTYQGRLESNGSAVDDPSPGCSFAFSLWDDASAGNQLGGAQMLTNVPVVRGVFSVELNSGGEFGPNAFNGEARWLQISVACPSGGVLQPLNPRQELTPAPHALALPGLYTQQNVTSPNLIGGFNGNLAISGVVAGTISGGGVATSLNRVTDDYGTVGGGRGNRAGNAAGTTSDRRSATVGGGFANTASGTEATVGGGSNNTASGDRGTVGGGNVNTASGFDSTVPGGRLCVAAGNQSFAAGNQAKANHAGAFVWADATLTDFVSTLANQFRARASGGFEFVSLTGALRLIPDATSPNIIGGHTANSVAGAIGSTISGGGHAGGPNQATAHYTTVGGGEANVAGGQYATVGGGLSNDATTFHATVGGGQNNTAGGGSSTVAGGASNTASGGSSSVVGGFNNVASGIGSSVGGGSQNQATAEYGTIGGGGWESTNPATGNRVTDAYGTVGGGTNNQAGNASGTATDANYATVAGGQSNTASAAESFVGGGAFNRAYGGNAAIAGGANNEAFGHGSFIGGGANHFADELWCTVSGGFSNQAQEFGATVGGGESNYARGEDSTIPGGLANEANGDYSFAAGRGARAEDRGAFVWSDTHAGSSSTPKFFSAAGNEFAARARGGVRFVTAINAAGDPTAGVRVVAGGSAWSSISDRNAKENFESVDRRKLLDRLSSIPLQTWNYKTQHESIRHIGPMAQDFHAAFGVGEDDRHISTIDADGVALAAIQGLHGLVKEKEMAIASLVKQNRRLEARLAAIEAALMKRAHPAGGTNPERSEVD